MDKLDEQQSDNGKPSKMQIWAQFLADSINRGEDKRAERIRKEYLFRQSLGINLKVDKKEKK